MSRQNPASRAGRERPPPPPAPTDEPGDGPPPVPKPRVGARGAGRRQGAAGILPTWPPPRYGGASGNATSSSPALSKDQQQRPPAPIPPSSSPPAASPGPPPARSPAPAPPVHQQTAPQLPPFRPSLSPPIPPSNSPPSPLQQHTSVPPRSVHNGNSFAFGTCLQESHEAIHKRHEDELHALESFRAHVFFRAKADREYAQELAKINSRANKTLSSVSQPSAIVQAWKTYLEMCVRLQKMFSDGAVIMSGAIVPAVDQLYKDKKGAKKVFDTDRARMQKEFKISTGAVHDSRHEYQRLLKTTETRKRKLEGSSDPKDQERNRRKFVVQANLLHSCHNSYVLSLLNANAHQEHWRSSLLPFCLDTLQHRMELQITEWKEALSQYSQATDFTQTYQDSFAQFYEALNMVDKEEEYVKFIQDNRQEQPGIDLFEFDTALSGHYCSPQTQPGAVVLNNLTNSAIRTKLEAMERDLEQHTRDITEKEEELRRMMAEPDATDMPMSPGGGVQLPKHVRMAQLQGEVKELESFVARKTGQVQVIRQAADAAGEGPPPLFDPLGEGVDVRDLEASVQGGALTTAAGGKSSVGGKMQATLFRGVKGIRGLGKKLKKGGKKDSDTVSIGYPKVDFDQNSVQAPDDAVESEDDAESLYDEPPEVQVEDEPWYYGDIDRKVAEGKCKQPGDYLVRYSARADKYVLTCNNNGTSKHFMIQTISGEDGTTKYRFESKAFPRIVNLLKEHIENGLPVTRASGAILLNPIVKDDKWALRHSDVQVGRRIGKGAFGEVCEATLRTSGERVAVKTCRSNELTDMDKFMQEADILKQYEHPNIVRLIGVCAEKDPVYIVMELMLGGALLEFLRKKGSQQPQKKLCGMAIDACRGMEYLEQNKCIHRDLAARNCLVGEGDVVKIADFGMSREDEGGIYIVQSGTRNIPIKWTAPEGLNFGKYTSASDVWSYGILLWEVFSCGSAPYPGMSNQEARSQVEMGYRMGPPADCPSDLHATMTQCWQYEPEERPNFTQILEMLTNCLSTMR